MISQQQTVRGSTPKKTALDQTRISRDSWDGPQGEHTIALYERALDRDPNNHLLLFDLARAYARRHRLQNAEQMLVRVLQLYPLSAMVHFKVAKIFLRIDRRHQAVEHYRRVLELDPLHPAAAEILTEMSALAAGA